jgi:hypothetical protein
MLDETAVGTGLVSGVAEGLTILVVAGGITEEEADVEATLDEVMMTLIGNDLHDRCGVCEKNGRATSKRRWAQRRRRE